MSGRIQAVEAYVRALRTGEFPAVEQAAKHLSPDVVLNGARVKGRPDSVNGFEGVLHRISGRWPNTAVYEKGYWSAPREDGDTVRVEATFPPMGSSPEAVNLVFFFDTADRISRIDQDVVPQPAPEPATAIPATARGMINGALANNIPLSIAYIDLNGVPNVSIRGSIQVYSDTELSVWVRNKEGGMARSIAANPNVGLLYRDNNTRSTLMMQGKGRIETDAGVCERVWNSLQDVEQKHESDETGCALIIELLSLVGNTPRGAVRMIRQA